jgi:hypothetical protein
MFNPKYEKLNIIIFFTILTVILTWPSAWHFFSSVPSTGADTMQVIGVAGNKANILTDQGIFRGTVSLFKSSDFNMTTIYAYFQLIFGRIVGYNILFFLSFILSGFGAYLLAYYFTKNKPASLIAGIIFAFSPFHIHNALSTNVGTMHQEWLPFFALYLFKFFDSAKTNRKNQTELREGDSLNDKTELPLKYFLLAGLFLVLIGIAEHQLLAFTAIFILFFLAYKLIVQPRVFLRPKLWIYIGVSVLILSILFFFMFRTLFSIANSDNNFLDAGLKSAVKYSNDSLSIFLPPNSHSFWPNSFANLREQFRRNADSDFSAYAGYSVLFLSLIAIIGVAIWKRKQMMSRGIWFWTVVAIGFYILSWGPYLHYKGVLDPPIKMPYWLVYQYLPFYKNIRTVGRMFIWSELGFSMLAAWGIAFINFQFSIFNFRKKSDGNDKVGWKLGGSEKILYFAAGFIIILEFLAVPIQTDSLLHSSFYEKLGQDKGNYSVLEVPGSTSYTFASRDLVWQSIHGKKVVNGYDFARINKDAYTFQEGTPIINTLLYDIPQDKNGNDSDIVKTSYYDIANEILNYYNIHWIILDKEALRGHPEEGDADLLYPAKAYIASVIKCSDEYEDEYLYACKVAEPEAPQHMYLATDYTGDHWVARNESKNGLQRWGESGAAMKLVNMSSEEKSGNFSFNVKVEKPLGLKVYLNGKEFYSKYITALGQKQEISVDLKGIQPGNNQITFGVYAADGSEIHSDKKSDTARIYGVDIE